MTTVLLVPRRNDGGHRDVLWGWSGARWRVLMPDVPIYEGHHTDGPFNRSAAINKASRLADADGRWDVAVVIDADVFIDIAHVREAIESASAGKVTWAHRRWRGISESDTARLIQDPDTFGPEPAESRDMDLIVEKTTPISWSCCVAIPRATFDDMGGFDERFRGWGFEDGAWAALVRAMYPWTRIEGDIYHWFHPRSDERIVLGEPALTASPDYVRNALLGRRYMIAAIRDHAVGDQPGEDRLTPEMVAVHVANLTKDDARFLGLARRLNMPEARDWAKWWPTLEELRAGAKAHPSGQGSSAVTLVVRTGGTPETWPTRREYLRASLASLAENVRGPIIQRVIYADWEPRFHAELAEIAAEHGFYVAGQGHHGYVASGQRMWRYLDKRAKGQYVFQAEDDFLYREPVDLADLIAVLETQPHLAQVALLREPAYESERQKGGILGWPIDSFTPVRMNGYGWLEHTNFWTQNPHLTRRSIYGRPWPQRESSERVFGDQLLKESAALRFAFWGDGKAQIEHIGVVRGGGTY